jgi:hypothetical protein
LAIYNKPQKAIFTVTEEDYTDVGTSDNSVIYDETEDQTSDFTDSSTVNSSDSITSNDDSSASLDVQSDQLDQTNSADNVYGDTALDESSYGDVGSKELSAQVDGFIGKNGSQLKLNVNKAGSSEIDLVNKLGKLWVKSDKIIFNKNAEEGKWLEYNLPLPQDMNFFDEVISADLSNVTVKGEKVGNEKIGKTRCYNYKIDSIDIGDALANVGITGVQSINGNVWIGINDKSIRKVNLNILPSSSSPFLAVVASLEFESSNVQVSEPNLAEVITNLAEYIPLSKQSLSDQSSSEQITVNTENVSNNTAVSSGATVENESSPATSSQNQSIQNDALRKADLLKIKNALEQYKSRFGQYPVATTMTKLNVDSNVLIQKLVPNFISALPKDPLDLEGWFYGYKSIDGKSYYLSTKIENTSDPEIKVIDNLNLYFLYNE